MDWIHLAEDGDRWWIGQNVVMDLQVFGNAELISWGTGYVPRRAAPWNCDAVCFLFLLFRGGGDGESWHLSLWKVGDI
jgi:hypothetical protein